MRLIVMYVRVAGPMGRTWHIISLSWPIGYVYVWHWIGCFHLCLMVILALSVYVWRGRLIVASMIDALACAHALCACAWGLVVDTHCLLLPLLLCCCRHCATQCVAKWSLCACAQGACWQHMLWLQPSCYHCCHRLMRYDSIVRSRIRPCFLLTLYVTQYEMHEGQVDNICHCCSCVFVVVAVTQHWYETKKGVVDNICCCCSHVLVIVAIVRRDV
jgi:hypothetical protein